MELTKINFADSIEDAIGGDRDACEFLYECTFGCFRQTAADVIGAERVSDQMMQYVYVRIFSELGSLQDPRAFLTWGIDVVCSAVTDYYKKYLSMTAGACRAEVSSEDYLSSVYDRNINPYAKIDTAEGQEVLRSLLDVLPAEQRICIILWAQNDSVQEIAEKCGLSEETVAGSLKYAKQMIERRLSALSADGLDLCGMAPVPYFIWLYRQNRNVIPQPDETAAEKHSPQLWKSILCSVFPQDTEADSGGTGDGSADPEDQETVLLNDPKDQETVLLNNPEDQETVLLNGRETVNLNHLKADDGFEDQPYDPYDRSNVVDDWPYDSVMVNEGVIDRNPPDRREEKPKKSGSGKKILIIVILCVVVAAVITAALVFLGGRKKASSETQSDTGMAAAEMMGDPSADPDEILSGITFTGISAGGLTDVYVLWPVS